MRDLPSTVVDVAIVGGGIAGSALATVLAWAGLGVAVIERELRFRDRVRGEGIHPWGVAEAHRLGLDHMLIDAGAVELPIWQTYTDRQPNEPSRWTDDEVNPLPEMTVYHPALQETSLDHAARAGARVVRPASVTSVRPAAGMELDFVAATGSGMIRARLIVGADGRGSLVRRLLGARQRHDPPHHRIGAGLLARSSLEDGMTHATTFEGGRMFTFPQGGGKARAYIACGAEQAAALQADRDGSAFIGFCAGLLPEGVLDGATKAGPIAFFSNADVWPSRIAADGAVLIGDAAGANDPSLGQGLSLVFRDVRELRDLLLAEKDWQSAIAEFERRRRAYFAVLREHARWVGILTNEIGPEADARRERVEKAREADPTAGGFAFIFSRGPDGLVADETARRHFFGDDVG